MRPLGIPAPPGVQVEPPLVDLKIAPEVVGSPGRPVPAYTVEGVFGSTAIAPTQPPPGTPLLAGFHGAAGTVSVTSLEKLMLCPVAFAALTAQWYVTPGRTV